MRNYRRDNKGRFARTGTSASRKAAKSKYSAAKKANAKAHRSRVKGSVKARGKEIVTTAPRRSKNLVGGTAIYAAGRYMGSAKAQSVGLEMGKAGLRGGAGRVGATRAMSKGLKRHRNAQAKKEYFKATGKSQARRNAVKIAAAGIVAGAVLYGVKNGHLSGGLDRDSDAGVTELWMKAGKKKSRMSAHVGLSGASVTDWSGTKIASSSYSVGGTMGSRGKISKGFVTASYAKGKKPTFHHTR